MMFSIVDVLVMIAEVWVYNRMGEIFLKRKKMKKPYKIIIIISIVLMQQGLLFISNIYIALILEVLLYLAFYHLLFRGGLAKKFLLYLSTMIMFVLSTYISGTFISYIKGASDLSFSSARLISISNLFIMLVILLLLDILFKGKNTNINVRWELFLLIPLTTLIGILAGLLYDLETMLESSIAFPIIILFINIFSYYIMANNISIREEKNRKRMSERLMENKIIAYEELGKRYYERRKLVHDYDNSLMCISDMIKQNKIDECNSYIQGLTQHYKLSKNIINTGNLLIDTLVSIKYQMALDKGIYLSINLCNLKDLAIDEYDLFSILSNLLDNAIEACEKLKKYDKEIHLDVSRGDKLKIQIRNPIEKKLYVDDDLIETSKKDKDSHGMGMQIIRDFVNKNNGIISIKTDNNEFLYIIEFDNK